MDLKTKFLETISSEIDIATAVKRLGADYINHEKETINLTIPLIENHSNWTFIDAGAHIGFYSILFALAAPQGQVVCFEPTSTIISLQNNIEILQNKKIISCQMKLENCALSNRSGQYPDEVWRVWSAEKVLIENFITIDDYVKNKKLDNVNFIKIDVDSFDYEVLLGSEETLKKFSPIVLVENFSPALKLRGHSEEEINAFMLKLDYKLHANIEANNIWMR